MHSYETLAACYDALMDDVDYDRWSAYFLSLLKSHGAERGELLDAACGTGALTGRLFRAGFRVSGLDVSEEMLRVASERLRKQGIRCPLICRDMALFSLPHKIDAVVCGCDGVNYLTRDEDVRGFFKSVFDALKDGGVLVFDVSSAQKLRAMDGQFYAEDRGDVAYIWNNAMENDVLTMDLSFFIRRDDGLYVRSDETHRQRAHEASHLCDLLKEAGFSRVDCYGFGEMRPPKDGDDRIAFAAVKGSILDKE